MSRIIQANLEHLYWIRLLWEMLAVEKPAIHPQFDEHSPDEFTRAVAKAMQDPAIPFAAFLAFKGHRAIGLLAGEIRYRPIGVPHYYGAAHWLYVRPEHRDKGVAGELILAGLQWLREQEIPALGNGHHTTHVDTVEVVSTYGDKSWEERGFTPFAIYHMRDVSDIALGRKPASPQPQRGKEHGQRR